MNSLLKIVGIVGIVCLASCAKTVEDPSGTNTNWLQSCDADDDCDDGASCLCGVCTVSCEDTAQCGEIESTRCEPLDDFLCGEASVTAACLSACEGDDDCSAIEDGRCDSGVCVRTRPDEGNTTGCPADRPQAECECPDQGDQVCTEGDTTFVCWLENGALTWIAVIDGLCTEPDPETCPTEERETLEECLANTEACYLQVSGGYCGVGMSTGPYPLYQLTREDAAIQITDAYTSCEQHSECRLVGTACNGCCAQGAIHSSLNDEYITNMTAACADYEGAVCDCSFEDLVPRCEDNRCAAVPRSELDCYSPEMPETAYDDGAVGCLCDDYKEKTICLGREGLICQPTIDIHYAWVAVEDGPCGEPVPDPDCRGGQVRATATACLDDFFRCWRLETGEYCGLVDTP